MVPIHEISDVIKNKGYYICSVFQEACPRFSYTIGLYQTLGYELVVAGLCLIDVNDVPNLIKCAVNGEEYIESLSGSTLPVELRDADSTWATAMARWAVRYYNSENIRLKQILVGDNLTIDTPNMRYSYNDIINNPWQYLVEDWPYPVPENSQAYCDSGIISGEKILSISRYEDDYWEISSGIGFDSRAKILPIAVIMEKFGLDTEIISMENGTAIRP